MGRSVSWITAAAVAILSAVVVRAAPKLELAPETYEWGRQEENKGLYEFRFVLRNGGDETLHITKVRPGCGCTKVDLRKDVLAPGESTEMTGTLKTAGSEGRMSKSIAMTTDDPLRPTSMATLSIWFPYAGVGLKPRYSPAAARLSNGTLRADVLLVNCETVTPVQVQAMELPPGWDCEGELPFTVGPEEEYTLRLFRPVAGDETPAAFEALKCVLRTDCDRKPSVDVGLAYRPSSRVDSLQTTIRAKDPDGAAAGTPQSAAQARWPQKDQGQTGEATPKVEP